MKENQDKTDYKAWLPLLLGIPFVFGFLYYEGISLDLKTMLIATGTIISIFVIVFLIKRYSK